MYSFIAFSSDSKGRHTHHLRRSILPTIKQVLTPDALMSLGRDYTLLIVYVDVWRLMYTSAHFVCLCLAGVVGVPSPGVEVVGRALAYQV